MKAAGINRRQGRGVVGLNVESESLREKRKGSTLQLE
jgi:hypothetical protein